VSSAYAQLPQRAVLISWWSYSTPLWYHRWVLGERPDVTIIDERNILDDGYVTIDGAIRRFLGKRPVYVVPPDWDRDRIVATFPTEWVETLPLSDGSVRFELNALQFMLDRLERPGRKKVDAVIGWRIKRRDPFHRLFIAKTYTAFVSVAFGLRVRDIDCAMKVFRREVFDGL